MISPTDLTEDYVQSDVAAGIRDGRIFLSGSFTPEAVHAIKLLPDSRYYRRSGHHAARITPCAAYRCKKAGFGLSSDLLGLAEQWERSQEPYAGDLKLADIKTEPWAHQEAAIRFAYEKAGTMLAMEMGCVDGETEYLSPEGWRRIDSYNGGDVAQYDLSLGEIQFVAPEKYHAFKTDKPFYHFKHTRGLDQVLTADHRILSFDYSGKPSEFSAQQLWDRDTGTSHLRFLTAAVCREGVGVPLDEPHLRLQVAVHADGHFPNGNNRVVFRLKKQRKKDRLVDLLKQCNLPYHRLDTDDGYSAISFYAPMREKVFSSHWWNASLDQRRSICDECVHWDGSRDVRGNGGDKFYSTIKESADFIQWCFVSTGRRASIVLDDRPGKPKCWGVHAIANGRTSNYCNYARKNGNAERIYIEGSMAYCFTVPSSYLVLRRNNCVFITGNCGKSLTSICLLSAWRSRKVLILCPKAVLGVWRREFARHYSGVHRVNVLDHSSAPKKLKAFRDGIAMLRNFFLNVFVINYESSWRDLLASELLKHHWDAVICDESHRIAANNSKQSNHADKLGLNAQRRLCLTGTPMPSSILDLFGQYRFLDAGIFGTVFTRYRSKFAETHPDYKNKVLSIADRPELVRRYKTVAFSVKSSSVLTLPPITYQEIPVELKPKTMKHYREMVRHSLLELEQGEITAKNAGVRLLRLAQMCSGHLKTDDGELITVGTEKQEVLADMLADIREPVVVFCRFTADLAAVRAVAKKLGRRYGEISGQQRDLTPNSTMPEGIDILGVQERAGGTGIDLTRSRIAIDFSRGYSLGDYQQKIARVHRPGQDRPTLIYTLIVPSTVDEVVVKAIKGKSDVIGGILEHIQWKGK